MNTIEAAMGGAGLTSFPHVLRASGCADVLAGGGPFTIFVTIFAPTDAAFEKFSRASLDHLLRGDAELLRAVAGYHFAAGKVLAARFAGKRIRALTHEGSHLIIDGKGRLRVNGAHVVKPDIIAGACVIHVIDQVLWPRKPGATL